MRKCFGRKFTVGILSLCAGVFLAAGGIVVADAANEKVPAGEVFEYENIKYQTAQTDGADERQGLLLYGYSSGVRADYGTYDGVFEADLKAVSESDSAPDLRKYSLVFTDNATGKSFSVGLEDTGSVCNIYVETGGEKAGICYYVDTARTSCYLRGYTAGYNLGGQYTRIFDGMSAKLAFDPAEMRVSVQFKSSAMPSGGATLTVWDFSEEYNDGKKLEHDLSEFGDYTVSVVFDEIRTGGRGELLVYEFGGYDFSSPVLDASAPEINVDFRNNAVVGREYSLPTASVTSVLGETEPTGNMKITVYDADGEIFAENCAETVTFPESGSYYLLYDYDGGRATAYYRIEAVDEADATFRFAYDGEISDIVAGVKTTVFLPVCSVSGNLFVSGNAEQARLTLKKDGVVVEGYDGIAGGVEYTFDAPGIYTAEYSVNVSGVEKSERFEFEIEQDEKTVIVPELSPVYSYGSEIAVEPATVYVGGQEITADMTVIYPSYKTVKKNSVRADETGEYTVRHTYRYGGEEFVYEQYFSVNYETADMFSCEDASVAYSLNPTNNEMAGVLATFQNYGTIYYDTIVDLSDNTRDDLLIEFLAQPATCGISDMEGIVVTFTDIYDSSNTMMVRVRMQSTASKVRAQGKGQYYAGLNQNSQRVESDASHEFGGFSAGHDFTQSMRYTFPDVTMKLYYDFDENALYGNPEMESINPYGGLIIDFDNPDHFSSPWTGFTTGEVYVSIMAYGISNTADLMVLGIDGTTFAEETVDDNTPPALTIKQEEDIPFAKTGTEYRIPEFYATDALSRVVYTAYEIRYEGETVPVTNGKMIPQNPGEYEITYIARDAYGNETRKSIVVTAYDDLSLPELSLEELPDTVQLGEVLTLPAVSYGGGAGRLSVSYAVLFGQERVDVEYNQFLCEKIGLYKIVCTVTDYIGQTVEETIEVNVTEAVSPVFDESRIVLPQAFFAGEEYVFDRYTARVYDGSGAYSEVPVQITVTDGAGTKTIGSDGVYVPAVAEGISTASISFVFASEGLTPLEIERTIEIREISLSTGYLQNYFVAENANIEADGSGITFTTRAIRDMSAAFINAVDAKGFTLRLGTIAASANFNRIVIRLRDSRNAGTVVELAVERNGDGLTCSINGGAKNFMSGSWTADGSFSIAYDAVNRQMQDGSGVVIGSVEECLNGMPFEGFESGKVYFDISLHAEDLTGRAAFSVQRINNQAVNYVRSDRVEPVLYVNGTLSGRYYLGTEIVIPSAEAYDVLNAVNGVYMTLRAPDGTVLMESVDASREYAFTIEQIGRYEISYAAEDAAGNSILIVNTVSGCDSVAPTLTLKAELPESVSVGEVLELPYYIVADNNPETVSVTVSVMTPDGILSEVTESTVEFSVRGTYMIQYVVVDENGNVNVYTYLVKAV